MIKAHPNPDKRRNVKREADNRNPILKHIWKSYEWHEGVGRIKDDS